MCHTMRYIILVTVCALLAGCRPSAQYPTELLMADSLTQCDADSAIRLLQDLAPRMSQAKESVRRYHQLLTIKAQDKAFIRHTSDSLVLDVLHYYQDGGDPCLLPEAYYYAGRVTRDLGDSPQALDYFHHALDAMQTRGYQSRMQGQEKRALKLQGNIHAQMGYLFRSQHLYDEAIKAMEESYIAESILKDTTAIIMNLSDRGNMLQLLNDYSEALSAYEEAEQYAIEIKDSILLVEVSCEKAALYNRVDDYDNAEKALLKYPFYLSRINKSSIYSIFANVYSHMGEKEKASEYYETLLTSNDIYARSNANLWLGNQASRDGNDKKALKYIRQYMLLVDTLNKHRNEEAIALTQSLYNYQLKEKEILNLKIEGYRYKVYIWICITFTLFLFFILYYEHARRKKVKRENDMLNGVIAAYKKDADIKQKLAKSALEDLKNHKNFLHIKKMSEDNCLLMTEDWTEIENLLAEYFPDFIPKLRGIHTYNETEWKLSLLLKMGFSCQEIANLIGRSYDAVYSSQSRLLKKIFPKGSDYPNWSVFISTL